MPSSRASSVRLRRAERVQALLGESLTDGQLMDALSGDAFRATEERLMEAVVLAEAILTINEGVELVAETDL